MNKKEFMELLSKAKVKEIEGWSNSISFSTLESITFETENKIIKIVSEGYDDNNSLDYYIEDK